MRPGESPFRELAKAIFVSKVNFCSSDAVNFITEILKNAQDDKLRKIPKISRMKMIRV
jgi:hypothetical protein